MWRHLSKVLQGLVLAYSHVFTEFEDSDDFPKWAFVIDVAVMWALETLAMTMYIHAYSVLPLRSVGRSNFDMVLHSLTTLTQKRHILEHIVRLDRMPVSGCRGRRFKTRHQHVVSLRKTLYPHCLSQLSCEMSTRWGQPREGCSVLWAFRRNITYKSRFFIYIYINENCCLMYISAYMYTQTDISP